VGKTSNLSYTDNGLEPDTEYTYAVRAVDTGRNVSEFSETVTARTEIDTVAPSAPKNLKINSKTGSSVNLVWSSSTDNVKVAGYKIYRDGIEIGTSNTTSYIDEELTSGTFIYSVVAFDSSGNVSNVSNYVLCDNEIPSAPSELKLVSKDATTVTISWSEAEDNIGVTGYVIVRQSGDSKVNIGPINVTSYTDRNLTSEVAYTYYVIAKDAAGNSSAASNTIEVVTSPDTESPSVPTGLKIVSKTRSSVTLSWNKSSDNVSVTGYEIYRDGIKVGTSSTNSYTDKDLTEDSIYEYTVKAYDAAGNISGESAPISVTTYLLKAPEGQKADAGEVEVTLAWDALEDSEFGWYRIYRASGDDNFEKIADNVKVLSIKDFNVSANVKYTYRVSAVDIYGNEGYLSLPVEVMPLEDTTAPVLEGFNASRTGDIVKLSVGVIDNVSVSFIEFLYRLNGEQWTPITQLTDSSERNKKKTVNYNWNIADLEDGTYEVKCIATDTAGNASNEVVINVYVRNSAPMSPAVVNAVAGELCVDISWSEVEDVYLDRYNIYRKRENGEFELLHTTKARTYIDNRVTADASYTYKVTSVDIFGHESTGTLSETVTVLSDITPPQIKSFLPLSGEKLKGEVNVSALATDNFMVKGYEFFYSKVEDGEKIWVSLGSSLSGTIIWDTVSNTSEGECELKVVVKDSYGNVSEAIAVYTIDNTPPEAPILSANASELMITLMWQPINAAEDFDHYRVYRSESEDGTSSFVLITRTEDTLYVDNTAPLDQDSYYMITAVDKMGNESQGSNTVKIRPGSDITAPVIDKFEPVTGAVIRSGCNITAHAGDNVGVEWYSFEYRQVDENNNAIEGKDWNVIANVYNTGSGIASIEWDTLAIGSTGNILYPDGNYQIRVTAYDKAGNNSSLVHNYVLANDPPNAPEQIFVKAGEWQLVVSWSPVIRPDFRYYVLYRKEGKDGEWEKIVNYTTSNIFIDRNRDPYYEYFYRVSVVNDLGRESKPTFDYSLDGQVYENIDTRALNQTSNPIILEMKPAELSRTNSIIPLEVLVSDMVGVDVIYEYAFIGTNPAGQLSGNETWQLIGKDNSVQSVSGDFDKSLITDKYSQIFKSKYFWDVSALADGVYAVRSVAVNKGNKESAVIKKYIIDREAPIAPSGLAAEDTHVGGEVYITWNSIVTSDLDYYELYRATSSEGPYALISKSKSTSYRDTGLENGRVYYYVVKAVDSAGNSSGYSEQTSVIPSALSDLAVLELNSMPLVPAYNAKNQLKATVKNLGYSKALGNVEFFYLNNLNEWVLIGSARVELAASASKDVVIDWTFGYEVSNPVRVKSVITTDGSTEDIDVNNNSKENSLAVNQPPIAAIDAPELVNSGEMFIVRGTDLEGKLSKDPDGSIVSYTWDMGDGTRKEGAQVTHVYQMPGKYSITLSVKDNNGAIATSTVTIQVNDNRCDLVVDSISWTPENPVEKDVIQINAVISNIGKGPSTGFLVGFYIDNKYIGYTRVDNSIAAGESIVVPFTWVGTSGVHVLKVVANDILDNLKEIDKSNNSKSTALTTEQVDFPDVKVTDVTWSPNEINLSSESPFVYRTTIINEGTADAERFFVSLYINDQWIAKQHINILAPGSSIDLSFAVKPTSGKHNITIKADDPAPSLVEIDRDDNSFTIETPEFIVNYPELKLEPLSWRPQESILTEGTSLTFETKIVNTSTIDITNRFNVDFNVDGKLYKTITIDKLAAGESQELWVRWTAQPGEHTVSVVADPQKTVTDSVYDTTVSAEIPEIKLIYPDLVISDVTWSPLSIKYGSPVTYIVRVSNQSVTSIFKNFNVGLYVDGKAVSGSVVKGLRGHSTAIVALTWTPNRTGSQNVKIVVDDTNELIQEPLAEGDIRIWERSFEIADRLVVDIQPNKFAQEDDLMAALYCASDNFIPLTVRARKASNTNNLLGPESGISAFYKVQKGTDVIKSGSIGFDYASKTFKGQIPIASIGTGTYTLIIEAGDGVENYSETLNIMIVQDAVVTMEVDKDSYLFGETVHISGNIHFRDGKPMAKEKVVLDLQLEPRMKDADFGLDDNGNMVLKQWRAQHVRIIETDENGHFEYDFVPASREAGEWHAIAYAYKRFLGTGAQVDFKVWGMSASPTELQLVASKNSQFSKVVTLKNEAIGGNATLTGISAVLVDMTPDSKVRATIDTSTLATSIAAGGSTNVVINVNAPLDCADTAQYKVVFTSAEGATATANIKLFLRPAVPLPITDPKGFEVGLNPGGSLIRKIKVTNKGLGNMENIRVEGASNIHWIKPYNLEKNFLAPGEYTYFDVAINPPEDTPLGQYQDTVVVTDGKYKAVVTIAAEVSSANRGTLSFLVTDDTGVRVSNAEVYLVGKEPYVQVKGGQEIIYYQNFYGVTDSNGLVTFEDKPIGEYTYTISARARKTTSGTAYVMPKTDAAMVEVTMENLPVQIEWTVTPTTIKDSYDIKLELTFGANIPKPYFGFVPPWISIPKQVEEPMIVEATVVNVGLVAITDVTATVLRENAKDTGISIVGGGYIGEIPAHGSAKIQLLVQPGYYNLRYGKRPGNDLPYNGIILTGNFVSFDKDTGLPVYPPEEVSGAIPFNNPGEKKATVEVVLPSGGVTVIEEIQLPDEQIQEIDYFQDIGNGKEPAIPGSSGASSYEIISLQLDQSATIERQAFNATLKISNGYAEYALQNLSARVVITDLEGNDVTSKNFIIPTGINGIKGLDGTQALMSGSSMTASWQIIPGDGLGGTDPAGETYLAKAIISYYVNGRYVETQTHAEEIVIVPQPKIKLHYYVPHNIIANQPFRLGVIAENVGYGVAKNLVIDSGQLEIKTNQMGLSTEFKILGTSFGSSSNNRFTLNLGDIDPNSQVSGYWIVKWVMYEENEDAEPLKGEFSNFKAYLTHKDYKGVQLNPLIVEVTTEIIGKDNLFSENGEEFGGLTLVDVGDTGFPNYLINLRTGLKIPIYVPQNLNVTKQPKEGDSTLKFSVPAPQGDPDDPGAPRYQVLLLKDPLVDTNISSVTRDSDDGDNPAVTLSTDNVWKDYGNIYIVDEIPVSDVKPEGYSFEQLRYFMPSSYTVDFTSGASIDAVEYSQSVYFWDPPSESYRTELVYYDVGHHPDEGDTVSVRASVINNGRSMESGKVEFIAVDTYYGTEEKVGEATFNNLRQYESKYVYSTWTPEYGGVYKLIARIAGREDTSKECELIVNHKPYADAGVDFSVDVKTPARFDGSRSYDKDGYIKSFIWEFGDGESAYGVCPTHIYQNSGTYKVKLTVIDDNDAVSTSEMQITVNETRADLRVKEIKLSDEEPEEGQIVTVTAEIYNGGYSPTDAPFLVCFYVDNKYQDYVKFEDVLMPGETKEVSFEWKNVVGNHMLTVIANDMGHSVDEADFDNNQKSRPVDTGVTNFPNLKIKDAKWMGKESGVVGWNEPVTLSVTIENDGFADAENFNVAVFADNEFIESFNIDKLPYKAGQNTVTVTAKWKARSEGKHTFKFVADGPLPHVVELDKSDNTMTIESPEIKLLYPDIKVKSLNINPSSGNLTANQPLVITATVSNEGYSSTNESFSVTLYADGKYIGSKECDVLKIGEEKFVSFTWNRPISGTTTIKAVVDENNRIPEVSEDNNTYTYKFEKGLNVKLPDLVIESIESIPQSGEAKFGDNIITKVKLRNNGLEAISQPFTTALYVNNKLVGSFETSSVLAPGGTTTGSIEWKADILPTSPDYKLDVYADVYNQLYIMDRNNAKASVNYKVGREYIVNYDELNEVYTTSEKPLIGVKVVSSDETWNRLSNEDGISAVVELYTDKLNDEDQPSGELLFNKEMNFNTILGKFELTLELSELGLTAGDYSIGVNVNTDTGIKTKYLSLKLVDDYIVSVNTSKDTYSVGEPIEIYGSVMAEDGITPLDNVEATLIIVGEKEWKFNVVTDNQGQFSHSFVMEEGFGGSYSLKAQAKFNGARKMSTSKVFYIEGVLLSIDNRIKVTAGRSVEVPLTVTNLGTLPVTGIELNKNFKNDETGITAEIIGEIPEELEAEENIKLKLRIMAENNVELGSRALEINFMCNEGYSSSVTTEINTVAAYSKADLQIGGVIEFDTYGNLKKDRIAASLRPGSTVTQYIRIANTGTAPITDIKVEPPAKLPWISITTTGTDLVLPIGDGLSIRDANSHATVSVHISPTEYVQPGQYEDVIIISYEDKQITVPVSVYVGVMNVGTTVIQVLDYDSIPVDNAKVELIGPMTSAGVQPISSSIVRGIEGTESIYRFENIAAGIYTLKIEAPYHKPFESSFEVQALIDLIPHKVYLEKMPYTMEWSADIIKQVQQTLPEGETFKLELETKIHTNTNKASLVSNFIGYELYDSELTQNLSEVISVKNTSSIGKIYDVQAQLITENTSLPEDALSLIRGSSSSAVYNLGDFEPEEVKDFRVYINDNKLYDVVQIQPTETPGTYTVIVPSGMTKSRIEGWLNTHNIWEKRSGSTVTDSVYNEEDGTYTIVLKPNSEGIYVVPDTRVNKFYNDVKFDLSVRLTGKAVNQYNDEYEVELRIPLRFRFEPYLVFGKSNPWDDDTVTVKAAFNPVYMKDSPVMKTVELSRNFIIYLGGRTVDLPGEVGPLLGSFDFSQGAVLDDEVIDAKFRLLNPSTYEKIENAQIELIISDRELGENGEIPSGANILNDRFNIYYDQTIQNSDGSVEYITSESGKLVIDSIAPGQINDINFKIQRKSGTDTEDYYGEVYLYINYNFTKGKDSYSGISNPKIVEIQAPAKIYLSYEFEKIFDTLYEVTVKATNAGLGSAKGLKLLPPIIRSTENVMITGGKVEGGEWIKNVSYLKFEEIKPGQTVIGKYSILSSYPIDLSQSIRFEVLCENSSGKVLVTPLTFNKVADKDEFVEIKEELERLKGNVSNLLDRTTGDLARAIADTIEYSEALDDTRKTSYLLDFLNSGFSMLCGVYDFLFDTKKLMKDITKFDEVIATSGEARSVKILKGLVEESLLEKAYKIYKKTEDIIGKIEMLLTIKEAFHDLINLPETIRDILEEEMGKGKTANWSPSEEDDNPLEDMFDGIESGSGDDSDYDSDYDIITPDDLKLIDLLASRTMPQASEDIDNLIAKLKTYFAEDDRAYKIDDDYYDQVPRVEITDKYTRFVSKYVDRFELENDQEIIFIEESLQEGLKQVENAIEKFDAFEKYSEALGKLTNAYSLIKTALGTINDFRMLKNSLEDYSKEYENYKLFMDETEKSIKEIVETIEKKLEETKPKEEEELRTIENFASILFTGDAQVKSEKDMIEYYKLINQLYKLDSDVLKVGHHGDDSSTSDEFLSIVTPDDAVISAGNVYGNPSEYILSKLRDEGINVYRTDIHDTIVTEILSCENSVAKVTFFNVGNGECILVESDGNKMIIDAGSGIQKTISGTKEQYFADIDAIESVDYLVITHPDLDHYNYLYTRLKKNNLFEVNKAVIIPNVDPKDFKDDYVDFVRRLEERYGSKVVKATVGYTFNLDNHNKLQFEVIGPVKDYQDIKKLSSRSNNSSIVMRMQYHSYDQDSNLSLVTHYKVREGESWVDKTDIRKLMDSGYIDFMDVGLLLNEELEDNILVKNKNIFKNWIENTVNFMKTIKINNTNDIREKLENYFKDLYIARELSDEEASNKASEEASAIVDDLPLNESMRRIIIINEILKRQDFNVIHQYNIVDAYNRYMDSDPTVESPYDDLEEIDNGEELSPGLKLKVDSKTINIEFLREESDKFIDEAIGIVEQYIQDEGNAPAYYPSSVILKYLKNLNKQIESIVGTVEEPNQGFGRYTKVNIFDSNGDEVHPETRDLTTIKDQYLKLLKVTSVGYDLIIDRAELNASRASLYAIKYTFKPYEYFIGATGIAGLIYLPVTKKIDSIESELADVEAYYKDMEDLRTKAISGELAKMILNTGIAYSRELNIAESVNNVITNIDKWRKVDPELPIETVSITVPDVKIKDGSKTGQGEAVVILKNVHTGALSVMVDMDIYGGRMLYNKYSSDAYSIQPGETVEIRIPFEVQRSTLVDIAGYRSVITVNLSEPETMSLGDPKGPFVTHFYAGTEEQIDALRENIKVTQPLGKTISGGEQEETEYWVSNKAKELRVVLASQVPSKIELHIYDRYGNHIGSTNGVGYENSIPESEVASLRNNNDMVVIRNPKNGPYRIVVKLPEDENEQFYSLEVVELEDVGAIPDVDIAKVVISNSRSTEFTINILESSYQNAIDSVGLRAVKFTDDHGNEITPISTSFKALDGTDASERLNSGIPAGMAAVVKGTVQFDDTVSDGVYHGIIRVTVGGDNLNPDFRRFINKQSVAGSVYSWYSDEENDLPDTVSNSVYSMDIPVIFAINTFVPEAPEVTSINEYVWDNKCFVEIKGTVQEGCYVDAYIDEKFVKSIFVDENKEFKLNLEVLPGVHQLELVSRSIFEITSETSYKTILTGRDNQGPSIVPISPIDGELIETLPIELKFRLVDALSGIDESTIEVIVDGSPISEELGFDTDSGIWSVQLDQLSDGLHEVVVSVRDKADNLSTLTWSFEVDTSWMSNIELSSDVYIIDNEHSTISGIAINTTVQEFINGLHAVEGAIIRVYLSDIITEISTGTIEKGMFVVVTAPDGITTKTYEIRMLDEQPPIITVPEDITVEATGELTIVDIGSAVVEDESEYTIENDAPGAYPLGTTIVTWTARDIYGNVSTATSKVTVVDTTSPELIVPEDITVEATGELTIVDIGNATAFDIFPVEISNNAPEGFRVGITTIIWTATDINGNVTTATQKVTVLEPKKFKYGDVNGDEEVNSIDLAYIRKYLLGKIKEFPTTYGLLAADVNGDGDVNSLDYAYMRQYILGKIKKFPADKD